MTHWFHLKFLLTILFVGTYSKLFNCNSGSGWLRWHVWLVLGLLFFQPVHCVKRNKTAVLNYYQGWCTYFNFRIFAFFFFSFFVTCLTKCYNPFVFITLINYRIFIFLRSYVINLCSFSPLLVQSSIYLIYLCLLIRHIFPYFCCSVTFKCIYQLSQKYKFEKINIFLVMIIKVGVIYKLKLVEDRPSLIITLWKANTVVVRCEN